MSVSVLSAVTSAAATLHGVVLRSTGVLAETGPDTLPPKAVNDNLVTPGVIGFIAIFAIAVVTVLLIIDMNRRVRRTRYRGEVREQIELERHEAAEAAAGLDDELRGHIGDQRGADRPDA